MPTDLVLRPADGPDADALADIHVASRRAAPMPPPVHTDAEVRQWLAGRLAADEVWLAEVEGLPVGYVRFTATWLDDLYVLPGHARQGIGGALLDVVRSRRPEGFCLWVFESNAPARSFYAGHGLVELERTDGSRNEERAPDVRMAWPGHEPVAFLRGLIDEVDEELGDLLARRAALTRATQPWKADTSRDPGREREVVARVAARAPQLGEDRVARIVHAVITESLDAARTPD